jgi:phage shock protein C
MDSSVKRLFRSEEDTVIAGVCGGIGTYFRLDPVLVRLVWICVTAFTGLVPGCLVYLLSWWIVPVKQRPVTAPNVPHSGPTIEVDPVA